MFTAFKKVVGILSQRKNSQSFSAHGNDFCELEAKIKQSKVNLW